MNEETNLKKLETLKENIIELKKLNNELENNNNTIDKNENTIKNPDEYILEGAKSTNNKEKLEATFKEELQQKYVVEDAGDIFISFIEHIGWKIAAIIGLIAVVDFILQKVSSKYNVNDPIATILIVGIILLVGVVPQMIKFIIRAIKLIKLKRLKFSNNQKKQLLEAQKLDKENEEYNKKIIEKEKDTFLDQQQKYLIKLKKNNETLKKENIEIESKILKAKEKINDNDCVGKDEKTLDVVNMLIYFIETKRADSIKEALHEYDKLVANQQLLLIEQEKMALQQQIAEQEKQDRQAKMTQDRIHQSNLESTMHSVEEASEKTAKEIEFANWKKYIDNNK